MSAFDREKAKAWVSHLRSFREQGGHTPGPLVVEASEDLDVSERIVWHWITHGLPGKRGPKEGKITRDQIEAYFEAFGVCARAVRMLEAQGRESPSVRQFQRWVNSQLTEKQRMYAKGGPAMAYHYRLQLQRDEPGRGLCLEMDHSVVPVLVIPKGGQRPVKPRITVAICSTTRVISGLCISTSPTEAEVLNTFGAAIARNPEISPAHGVPKFLRIDGGPEFTASGMKANAKELGIRHIPLPPYSPHLKGKVEKWFRFFKEDCCADMPCYLNGPKRRDGRLSQLDSVEPWPFERFVAEVLKWVAFYNFEWKHSELDNLTPAQAWAQDTTIINDISPEKLRRFTRRIVRSGEKIRPLGVRAHKRFYTDYKLERHIGKKAELRGLPHDRTSVDVYLDGEFLTTAYEQRNLTEDQKEKVMTNREKHSVDTAAVATAAKKKAKRRHQGVTSQGPLKDVTDVQPTAEETAAIKDSGRLLDRMGVAERRGGKRKPRSQRRGDP